jgi:phage terminase Nu1 subunit (DNA packaging protein)
MISAETTATTAEICALVCISKQRLGALEREGVIRRSGPNCWPLVETVGKLFSHARAQRTEIGASRARFEAARAKAQELKNERETGDLSPTWLCANFGKVLFGRIRAEHVALPSVFTRDLAERDRLAKAVDAMDHRLCDFIEQEEDELWREAEKLGRRRRAA